MEELPTVKGNIVEYQTLTPVEADTEAPLLPFHKVSVQLEAGSLGLNNPQWLERRTGLFLLEVVCIFGLFRSTQLEAILGLVVTLHANTQRQALHCSDLQLISVEVHDHQEVQRMRVWVRVRVFGLGIPKEEEDLGFALVFVVRVACIVPRLSGDVAQRHLDALDFHLELI